jgi:hypothetical protein
VRSRRHAWTHHHPAAAGQPRRPAPKLQNRILKAIERLNQRTGHEPVNAHHDLEDLGNDQLRLRA